MNLAKIIEHFYNVCEEGSHTFLPPFGHILFEGDPLTLAFIDSNLFDFLKLDASAFKINKSAKSGNAYAYNENGRSWNFVRENYLFAALAWMIKKDRFVEDCFVALFSSQQSDRFLLLQRTKDNYNQNSIEYVYVVCKPNKNKKYLAMPVENEKELLWLLGFFKAGLVFCTDPFEEIPEEDSAVMSYIENKAEELARIS